MSKGKGLEKMSADEAKWRTERDAGTMRDYAELTGDPKRLAAAERKLREDMNNTRKVLETTSERRGAGGTGKVARDTKQAKPARPTAEKPKARSTAGKPPAGPARKAPKGANALKNAFLGRKSK